MNRHESNPFLSDWDESETTTRNLKDAAGIFDKSILSDGSTCKSNEPSTNTRRHSSQLDGNSASNSGSNKADRRLYQRNMSSFEAASLTLEHHQALRNEADSGKAGELENDLIAKMTADFRSAIETNDKQFATTDESANAIDGTTNPFDPFETIMDDDMSYSSPATTTDSRRPKEGDDSFFKSSLEADKSGEKDLDSPTIQKPSISTQNFEDELFPIPTEDIVLSEEKNEKLMSLDEINSKVATDIVAYSIEKASLLASKLLASKDSPQDASSDAGHESATEAIKNTVDDKPADYFDPFETVVDKDAITTLTNESHQLHDQVDAKDIQHKTQLNAFPSLSDHNSIETIIESAPRGSQGEESLSNLNSYDVTGDGSENELASKNQEESNLHKPDLTSIARTRPRPATRPVDDHAFVAPSITPVTLTPLKKAKQRQQQQKKKKKAAQSDQDSSDSSSEDEQIKIVIKARDPDKHERETNETANETPALVPLLPPPPSRTTIKQARERGQMDDVPSISLSYTRHRRDSESDFDSDSEANKAKLAGQQEEKSDVGTELVSNVEKVELQGVKDDEQEDEDPDDGQFIIRMTHDDDLPDDYDQPETPLYDDDTSYELEEFPAKFEGSHWVMFLRYPPKKKLASARYWKQIAVKLDQVPLTATKAKNDGPNEPVQTCIALQIYNKSEDKKPMQEIPLQATYTVSEISSQQFDQFGKIFTIKLQYVFYKEKIGIRQGQLARFIHSGHIGSSTTSGGHGVDPLSVGAIKRLGAPIEHSPQISQIIKLGCANFDDIKQFKYCLEDHLFRTPIIRDRALSVYKTEEVQMVVRDETYIEVNQVGTITRQMARVRLFFLSFLNGMPTVDVGINDYHRQGREVVGRMDILPIVTDEWIRLEAWELHSTVDKEDFENVDSRAIKFMPPDATFFELMRFRVRPPKNRELPLQVSANMSVTRTKISINVECMVPGSVSRKHGQIPCESIAIKVLIPECWIYFFREEKHFRMGSKKSVNKRPGKIKGIERFLGGGGASSGLANANDELSLIEVTSGQAKYEHHHNAIVWRAVRWPKESQQAYVQNSMKIRLPLTAYDKMPDNFYEFVHVEYTMPATTVSHTTLRSISVSPCDDEPPEKFVKYSAKYEYKVKMRLSVNLSSRPGVETEPESSPIVIMKQQQLQHQTPLKESDREEDSDDDSDTEQNSEGHESQ